MFTNFSALTDIDILRDWDTSNVTNMNGIFYGCANLAKIDALFGGMWTRVESRFLYCMVDNAKKPGDSSVALSVGGTGGSLTHTHTTGNCTLTIDQIPSHSHGIKMVRSAIEESGYGFTISDSFKGRPLLEQDGGNYITRATGGGQAHNHGNTGPTSNIPPYMAVYCWRRTA